MASTVIGSWLVTTKLCAPARRPDLLLRPRLIESLRKTIEDARLTLISAPAGAGKTSLLAELPHAFPNMRWAWLLLDEEDNDPTRFLAALAAALERVDPSLAEGVLEPGSGLTGGKSVVAAIVNNVTRVAAEPITLVLDDLHVITNEEIHATLEYLLDRLPPQLRLVIGTRHDPPMPLARLRARGQLAEIRLSDLSFTEQETGLLANQCLGLDLSPAEVTQLHARTEGWAAALRLLAISITQAGRNRESVLSSGMRGSRRIFDFLAEEVLDRQTPELRRFLLETSILSSLVPTVCDALTGREDSSRILEDLYRRNLYVVAADEDETSYRYHDLFADFLRERLRRERPEDWQALHLRAAHAETSPHQRLRHLLAAQSWDLAVVELERIGPEYIRRGFVTTMRRWIGELPEDVQHRNPRILYLLGHAIWTQFEFAQAEPYLEQALVGFRRLNDPVGQAETLLALANSALMNIQFGRLRELLEEALTFDIPPASRVQLRTVSAWNAIYQKDWPEAEEELEQVFRLVESGEGVANPLALQVILFSEGMNGYVDRVEHICRSLRDRISGAPDLAQASYYMLKSAVHLYRGEMEDADRESQTALAIARECGQIALVTAALPTTFALSAAAQGRWSDMEKWADEGLDENRYGQITRNWRLHYLYLQGRARWNLGDLAGLKKTYEDAMASNPVEAPAARPYRFLIRGMLRMAERSYAQAEEAFREALREEEGFRVTRAISSARVSLGYVLLKRGDPEQALEVFLPFLLDCKRWNTVGQLTRENPIVIPLLRLAAEQNPHREFAESVLGILGAPSDVTDTPSGESLSDREMEVLRVMAEGLGNREIGERLFVSEATVKTHVQRVMRKLDANSRTQAVARARERMLL